MPWNYPPPESLDGETPIICDLYGNDCFDRVLDSVDPLTDCSYCLQDCDKQMFAVFEAPTVILDTERFW